ncbi:MAG: hypothetical protein HYZ25_07640 [Chloroflexi bacterium]|nr:hypothetical protein [Chloroflexota bacterium]
MTRPPLSVIVTFGLILFNAIVWWLFGIIVAMGLHLALPDMPIYKVFLSIAAFGATAIQTWLLVFLKRRSRTGYFLALAFFGLVIAALFLDDFGWADLAFLVINVLPAALLLKDRNWYLHPHLISTGSPS